MQKTKFTDAAPGEREQLLRNACRLSDKMFVRHKYEPEEIQVKNATISKNLMEIGDLEDQLKEAKAEIKGMIKPLQAQNSTLLDEVRKGYFEGKEECFGFDDQDLGVMDFYDANGRFVSSRPLLPTERLFQGPQLKTGTEND